MTSYRVTLDIAELRPGGDPATVLPAARDACAAAAQLEAANVAVVSGQARLVIRFAADDDETAGKVGATVAVATDRVARVARHALTRWIGGRWVAAPDGADGRR